MGSSSGQNPPTLPVQLDGPPALNIKNSAADRSPAKPVGPLALQHPLAHVTFSESHLIPSLLYLSPLFLSQHSFIAAHNDLLILFSLHLC